MAKDKKCFKWSLNTKLVYLLFILMTGTSVFAQQFTISGRITDAANGEDLIGGV